jgi:hypothetical protein
MEIHMVTRASFQMFQHFALLGCHEYRFSPKSVASVAATKGVACASYTPPIVSTYLLNISAFFVGLAIAVAVGSRSHSRRE